jgi:hypothetical protein
MKPADILGIKKWDYLEGKSNEEWCLLGCYAVKTSNLKN